MFKKKTSDTLSNHLADAIEVLHLPRVALVVSLAQPLPGQGSVPRCRAFTTRSGRPSSASSG